MPGSRVALIGEHIISADRVPVNLSVRLACFDRTRSGRTCASCPIRRCLATAAWPPPERNPQDPAQMTVNQHYWYVPVALHNCRGRARSDDVDQRAANGASEESMKIEIVLVQKS